ncbi:MULTISPECIES: hypothetical protein [Kitasatospora]|uniref:Uncharacterized protein n=1 Tax=Kitasatospora cystarginea TaxID=58350 RepID=A0ABN3EIZ1_9ACTN
MTWHLRLGPDQLAIYQALPDHGRADLAVCLLDCLADPLRASMPYGADDGVMRTIARGHIQAVVLVGEKTGTVTVVQVTYAG